MADRSGAVHASSCRRCGPETVLRFQSPSRQGESHPLPLTEPCIRLSTYTARGAHAAVPGCGQPCRLLPPTVVGPHDHPGHPACFAPPALPGFIATTRQSAPVRCIGTLPLAVFGSLRIFLRRPGEYLEAGLPRWLGGHPEAGHLRQHDRFPRSASEPKPRSRHLYAGHRLGSKQVASQTAPEASGQPRFWCHP